MILLLTLVFLMGCHCPSPVGFCAHDLQYMVWGLPFIGGFNYRVWIADKLKSFHWFRHKDCAHHPKGEICDGHDHVIQVDHYPGGCHMRKDPKAAICDSK